MIVNSINKPVVACAWHIHEFSANRIKDPFTGKWVNKTQAQFDRIMRHRTLSHSICPSCERIMNYSIERESAGAKTETDTVSVETDTYREQAPEGQPPAVAGRLDSAAAKGDKK